MCSLVLVRFKATGSRVLRYIIGGLWSTCCFFTLVANQAEIWGFVGLVLIDLCGCTWCNLSLLCFKILFHFSLFFGYFVGIDCFLEVTNRVLMFQEDLIK